MPEDPTTTARPADPAPYDALLLVSFGGPEGPDDVLPFLENVTRGRGIPRERLEAVAEHYLARGGVSPINGQNRALLAAIRADLAGHGLDLPVYWGNRNWAPMLADAFREIAADGHRRVLALFTSAYSSYSGCRQYREDLAAARSEAGADDVEVDRVRAYFNHPGFVGPMVDSTLAALDSLDASVRDGARLVFVTHSVPIAMDEGSGPAGHAYVRQHQDVARLVASGVARRTGTPHAHDLAYCSRSGPPTQPWLEPDVNDHLRAIAAEVPSVVLVPIGFVSDHMEVVHDLDTEAMETAAGLGLPAARAATVGTADAFVAAIRDLVLERAAVVRGDEGVVRAALGELGASHDICPAGCCPNPRTERPALCGVDTTSVDASAAAGPAATGHA